MSPLGRWTAVVLAGRPDDPGASPGYGYKLAAADALARLHPDVLRAMRLPSQAHRI